MPIQEYLNQAQTKWQAGVAQVMAPIRKRNNRWGVRVRCSGLLRSKLLG